MRTQRTLSLLALLSAPWLPGCAAETTDSNDAAAAPEPEPTAEAAQAIAITRRIPIRFIQVQNCTFNCGNGYRSTADLHGIVEKANEVFAPTGIELWIKSNELVNAPLFASNVAVEDDENTPQNESDDYYSANYKWSQVKEQLGWMFPGMRYDAFADNEWKTQSFWQAAIAAYYGDPDVLHVFVALDGGADAQYPDKGRHVRMAAMASFVPEGSALAHELGHYFGLLHTFDGGTMPAPGGGTFGPEDRWDLYYCDSNPPDFFPLQSDYLNADCATAILRIDKKGSGRCTSGEDGTGPFTCTLPLAGGGTKVLQSGAPELDGLFRVIPNVTHNPPFSYAYSANAMGYRQYWQAPDGDPAEAAIPIPRFLSDSQIPIVEAHVNGTVDFPESQKVKLRPASGATPAASYPLASLRSSLGASTLDFMYWANGTQWTNDAFSFTARVKDISLNTYQTVSGDFNGDGYDDVLWCNPQTTNASIWWGNFNRQFTEDFRTGFCPTGISAIRAGRFNDDARVDILFYGPGSNTDWIYYGEPNKQFRKESDISVTGDTYNPIVGDFNGDGRDDIFWYKPSDGIVHRWYCNANETFTHHDNYPVEPGGPFVPIVGNFDGSTTYGDDIFWYKAGAGGDKIWYASSTATPNTFDKVVGTDVLSTYTPAAGDFDGDGKDDIFWDRPNSPNDYIWRGSSSHVAPQFGDRKASVHGTFRPIPGDFDGDDQTDIFWYRQ